jgi:hypothetical protein
LFHRTTFRGGKTMTKEKVTFEKNVPTEVELAYPIGRRVTGPYGESLMYTLKGDRVMFLPLPVGARLEELHPKAATF